MLSTAFHKSALQLTGTLAVRRINPRLLPFQAPSPPLLRLSLLRQRRCYHSPAFTSLMDEIEDANQRYRDLIQIQQWDDDAWCVVALRDYKKDQVVLHTQILEQSSVKHSHTLQIDKHRHVLIDLPSRFINHACESNLGIRVSVNDDNSNDADSSIHFVALHDIPSGQELLWDYECTEYEMDNQFQCRCGSSKCRGQVRGFKRNCKLVLDSTPDRRNIAPYLLESYEL